MKKHTVIIDWLHHDGRVCAEGETIELAEAQAAPLLECGAVAPVDAEPDAPARSKGKKAGE